jgi:hypothetical protein
MNRVLKHVLLLVVVCWMSMAFAQDQGIPTQTNTTSRFRTGPSSEWRVQATLAPNTPLNVDGRDGTNNAWVRGITPDGMVGWIASSNTTLSTDQLNSLAIKTVESPFSVPAPAGGAPATTSNSTTTTTTTAAVVAPVQSLAPMSGFAYGGHVSGFGGDTVSNMQRAGMTWVKKQIRYGDGQDASDAAGMIQDAHGKGFRILLGIVGQPSQLSSPGYNDRYAAYVASAAAAGADAIEVWNEPNIDREWPNGAINPASYTALLATAYNAIKSANPATMVISGAPAPTGFFGGCHGGGCDDNLFLAGMAAAGAANYMDCVGVHYNEGIVPPTFTSGDPRGNSGHYTRYLPTMISTYSNAFGGRVPLCFTELGYLTPEGYGGLSAGFAWASNVTVAQQAEWVDGAVSYSRNSGRVRLVIIWNIDFTGTFGDDPMGGYALIRPDGSCPACNALGS